jgi:hypothetical protein
VYPDPRVASFVTENFIPVRFHVKENPQAFERFGAQWTPTILIDDPDGKERHRIEGFLPADAFLAQLQLGLARAAFSAGDWKNAEQHYESVAGTGDEETAPEAMYWAGVARYKGSNDASHLGATHKRLSEKYPNSSWAKKASVWG